MTHNTVLGLDVGSHAIKALVAEASLDKLRLIAGISRPSAGMRKGVVVDMDAAAHAIGEVMNEVRSVSRSALKNIYLSIGGADVRSELSRGIVAVSRPSSEIYQDDVDRVIQASQAINLTKNRMILHTVTHEYVVDGVGDIRDPLGMVGDRIEVSSLIVHAFAPAVKNLVRCVEVNGGAIGGLVFAPLASARAALNKNQRELGSVVVDVGFGMTGVAVYEEDRLLHTAYFPVGGGHITNDIAIALKVPVETAEKVKLSYGYALAREVSSKEAIDMKRVDLGAHGSPSRRYVAEVIESRLTEMFDFVNRELQTLGRAAKLPAGVVLTGGGAKLPGIVELAREALRLSVQIGIPEIGAIEADEKDLIEYIESPEYTTVLGLLLVSKDMGRIRARGGGAFFSRLLRNLLP
ncbi:MAG: cell division protein FtsA [Candidatus Colwellbacteria bacterium]|nr:cell division protein FtsA [Candidatus Colwellbacteria bacterium]